jgi:hypothetical protein
LTDALHSLMNDPTRREELGRQGKRAVHAGRSDEQMARATVKVYQERLEPSRIIKPDRAAG